MKRSEDPGQKLASEARDDWADALADGIGCRPLAPPRPNPAYVDAPHETHCIRYDRVTGKMLTLVATSENEAREFFDHSKDYCDPES